MRYELFIGWRHLKDRRTKFLSAITGIAIAGVFLGVMALTSVVAVTGGFQRAFQDRVLGINSHLLVISQGRNFANYDEVQTKIESVPGVEATSPFILHEMIASHARSTSGVLVKGIEPSTMSQVSDLPKYLKTEGALEKLPYERFPADGEKATPSLVMGKTLADDLKLETGDTVRVTSPLKSLDVGSWSSDSGKPLSREFRVVGIYQSGFHEFDSRLVLTDYRALQDFFGRGDTVTGIDTRVEQVFQVGSIEEQVTQKIDARNFRMLDWRELNHNLFTSLKLQRIVLAILFCFIVLVASFNIICTLIMIVLDKQKDIAILKAMGATRWSMLMTFMVQGVLIGAVGTLLGVLGGLGVSLGVKFTSFGLDPSIYMIDHLPVDIRLWEFGLVAGAAMVISVLATLGPAWWASRLNPVEGLRYE
jgi:lipoprotein-releasing system permease protein